MHPTISRVFILVLLLIGFRLTAQTLNVNAGANIVVCPRTPTTIGGSPSASGGTPPYTYNWQPVTGLSANNVANPSVNLTASQTYTLTVTDAAGHSKSDTVKIQVNDIIKFGAGNDPLVCFGSGSGVTLGDPSNYQGNYTFSWAPTTFLNNANLPKPTCTPTVTTTYTLTINSPQCGMKKDSCTVTVFHLIVNAGPDTVIQEGQSITLHGSPNNAISMTWAPTWWIHNPNTPDPDVAPPVTTQYIYFVTDANGCKGSDTIRVIVIPGNELFFYNTITPNWDGSNDVFYIGNIEKYPDNKLEIYNRYGQLLYSKNSYQNDWDGKYMGNELPEGTYYYILDTKTDKGKIKGSLTIIR